MIYLDYSANTPADPRVAEAFLRASLDYPGNPNSRHPAGQAAAKALADARAHIAALLGVLPEELIFTSGATEANNLALLATMSAATSSAPRSSIPPSAQPSAICRKSAMRLICSPFCRAAALI